MSRKKGKLYVISGPSGTGKGTICAEILKEIGNEFSVSMTTRSPRPGEVHGKEYFFVTKEEFENGIKQDFLDDYQELWFVNFINPTVERDPDDEKK